MQKSLAFLLHCKGNLEGPVRLGDCPLTQSEDSQSAALRWQLFQLEDDRTQAFLPVETGHCWEQRNPISKCRPPNLSAPPPFVLHSGEIHSHISLSSQQAKRRKLQVRTSSLSSQ